MSATRKTGKFFIIMAFSALLVAGALSFAPAGDFEKACPTGWYFAEGYTGGSFDTWILIQNPFAVDAKVQLRFLTPNMEPLYMDLDIAGETRTSVYLNSLPGLEDGAEVATEVKIIEGGNGIICERAMYFDYESGIGDRAGGHSTIGSPGTSSSWYLPEGHTGDGFDTYVLLMNPNDSDVSATVKLMKPGEGTYYPFKVNVPAGKRMTLKLNDLVWTEGTDNVIAATAETPADPKVVTFENTDVATVIYADKGIVAERAMYFDYYGKEGGSNSIGATGTSSEWYLPEGYTGGDFDTWVTAMNPSGYTVDITYTFYSNAGAEPVTVTHENVAPWSRDTICVDTVPGLEGTDVSTKVTATRPVTLQAASVDDPVERYAVLYGVETTEGYGDGPEVYAQEDMYDLKHRLVDYCGFTYDKIRYRSDTSLESEWDDITLEKLQDDMEWLAAVADANDIVVFDFVGNSTTGSMTASLEQDIAENQIVLSDGVVGTTALKAYFDALQTENFLAILDCDNAGEMAGELAGSNRIVMGSCATDEIRHEYLDSVYSAASTESGSGPFANFFVKGLSMAVADVNGNGLVSAEEAFNYAAPLTTDFVDANETAETQTPFMDDQVEGELDLTVTDVPTGIVAERSVYFNYGTANDGATSIGASKLHNSWFLAEGYTGGGFDTYILVVNPYDNWQEITFNFMTPSGAATPVVLQCPPNYRLTLKVDDIPGLEDSDVSTRVTARYMDAPGASSATYVDGNSGVAVERAMYFVYTDPGDNSVKTGGTCSIGFGE